ncbi:MAG: Rossmann-like domain-containing protein [Oceanidesulfovibrio sp.]
MHQPDQRTILQSIAADVRASSCSHADAEPTQVASGSHLLAVHQKGRLGLASRLHGASDSMDLLGERAAPRALPSLSELADSLPDHAVPDAPSLAPSLALAAANALLPVPDSASPLKGQDLLLEHGAGKNAVVIGHFPFVSKIAKEFNSFHVLELHPRPGDLPATAARDVLPGAGVVAATGTTLLNGTLANILALCPNAFVLLLGPSTPFAHSLFRVGVDAIAGNAITDPDAVIAGVSAGLPYRKLNGVESLIWLASDI